MASVGQAHLPGNYELYDPASNELGPVLCKMCWEDEKVTNVHALDTFWVSSDGWLMVWWLCQNHGDEIKSGKAKSVVFLKSESGVVKAPRLEFRS